MPSFLITSTMPKALRLRVEASLEADLRQRTLFPGRSRPRKYLRALLALAVLGLAVMLVVTYRQSRREVEQKRAAILAEYQKATGALPPSKRRSVRALAEGLGRIAHTSGPWSDVGDHEQLGALMDRRLLYVRGDAERIEKSSLDIARESTLDALAICLAVPPANLRESTLLRAMSRVPSESQLHALSEALAGGDFLGSGFVTQTNLAKHMQQLERLAARLQNPALARALGALEAEVLLLVVDEPKAAGVVSDFDGEAPHTLRLWMVDLASGRVVWQRRAQVDPGWISEKSRLAYSRALDSCRLAFELRQPPSALDPH